MASNFIYLFTAIEAVPPVLQQYSQGIFLVKRVTFAFVTRQSLGFLFSIAQSVITISYVACITLNGHSKYALQNLEFFILRLARTT